jgi:histidinol-phosphatase
MTISSDLDLLLLAADIADRESMRIWRTDDLVVEIKPDGSPVTPTDRLIERRLRELLTEHRPHDRVLGEEEGDRPGADPAEAAAGARRWVIDPIDGTGGFVAGTRAWSTLVALEVDGDAVAGMVTMPAIGRRWWGTVADGAFTDGSPAAMPRVIRPSGESSPERMRWASGPAIDELDPVERAQLGNLERHGVYVPPVDWTTYPALMVAEGTLDASVHFGQHWDHAALAGVVIAAGGKVAYEEPATAGERFAATYTNGVIAVRADPPRK